MVGAARILLDGHDGHRHRIQRLRRLRGGQLIAARVLICEPSDDVRELLATAIRRLGYEAVAYEDAGRPEEFDVVVLEPGSERYLKALKELGPLPPVVALSIYAPEEQPNGIAIAAQLAKPFSLGELGEVLGAALRPPD